jgi:hypothetical protein
MMTFLYRNKKYLTTKTLLHVVTSNHNDPATLSYTSRNNSTQLS